MNPHRFRWRLTRLARGRRCRLVRRDGTATGSRRSKSKGWPTSTRFPSRCAFCWRTRCAARRRVRRRRNRGGSAWALGTTAFRGRARRRFPLSPEAAHAPGFQQESRPVVDLAAMRDAVGQLGGESPAWLPWCRPISSSITPFRSIDSAPRWRSPGTSRFRVRTEVAGSI